jgi:hypothetical protein
MNRGPIFVAGVERSGTSLMYALLATHPNVAMTRRTNLWRYFYGQFGDLGEDQNLDRLIEVARRYKRLAKLSIDWEGLRRDFVETPRTYPWLFELIERQYADRMGKPRWGDKSLLTERYADSIVAAYPGARMIHVIRDPRDRYASVQKRWGRRRGGVGMGVAEWAFSASMAERNAETHPGAYMVVRYEDLVSDPAAITEKVCGFIGEPYLPEMLTLKGDEDFRGQGSNSSYGPRSAGVISPDSIGKYSRILSDQQVRFIETSLGETMDRFGYARSSPGAGWAAKAGFWTVTYPFESVRSALWQWRDRLFGRRIPSYRFVEEGRS